MRLTAEAILRAPNFVNTLSDRELDLRGNKIAVIENLGATQDQFDAIDLSDNEIKKLKNFPLLPRLRMLLLNNNRIIRIAPGLGQVLPHLETLVLTNNRLTNLSDIDPLAELTSLRSLSLLDNPVTKQKNYRLYTIAKLPKLKLLDFKKIKQQEKVEARKMFRTEAIKQSTADSQSKAKTFVPGEGLPTSGAKTTKEDRTKEARANTQPSGEKAKTEKSIGGSDSGTVGVTRTQEIDMEEVGG